MKSNKSLPLILWERIAQKACGKASVPRWLRTHCITPGALCMGRNKGCAGKQKHTFITCSTGTDFPLTAYVNVCVFCVFVCAWLRNSCVILSAVLPTSPAAIMPGPCQGAVLRNSSNHTQLPTVTVQYQCQKRLLYCLHAELWVDKIHRLKCHTLEVPVVYPLHRFVSCDICQTAVPIW